VLLRAHLLAGCPGPCNGSLRRTSTPRFDRGDAELIPLLAGQGLHGLRDGQAAAEVVEEIAEEAEAVLASLAG
jgi:hypothetical protein